MPRANWKGYLDMAGLSCEVASHSAASTFGRAFWAPVEAGAPIAGQVTRDNFRPPFRKARGATSRLHDCARKQRRETPLRRFGSRLVPARLASRHHFGQFGARGGGLRPGNFRDDPDRDVIIWLGLGARRAGLRSSFGRAT